MKPINFTDKGNGKIIFHHSFSTLRKFLEHGFKEGNNGFILIGRDGEFSIFKGFGTIENPYKSLRQVDMQHDPMYDGKVPPPEEVIKESKIVESYTTNYRLVIWDARDNKTVDYGKHG